MKTRVSSNFRPLSRGFYPFFIVIAVLWGVPRDAHAQLYVTQLLGDSNSGFVNEYDVDTGAVTKAKFITGLIFPTGLALSDKDNTLFVANGLGTGTVGKYDASTGAPIDTKFIKGLQGARGLAVSGNTLFVAISGMATVGKYDATTGKVINDSFVTMPGGPYSVALSGNTLFVATFPGSTLGVYNAITGKVINTVFPQLDFPIAVAVFHDRLFVAEEGNGTVGEYDAATGAAINLGFITGVRVPYVSLAAQVPSTPLFGNEAYLFLADALNGTVGKYNITTGQVVNANFISGLNSPFGIAFKGRPPVKSP